MDEDNIITLNDENGNEVEFEFLDLIPYRQNEYVVLLPIGDSDGQVVILQLKEIDDETEEYVGVENEFVLETVFALFLCDLDRIRKRIEPGRQIFNMSSQIVVVAQAFFFQ